MNANVNLDALLEKMKAELERAREFGKKANLEKAKECLEEAKKFIEERKRRESNVRSLESKIKTIHENYFSLKALAGWIVVIFFALMILFFLWGGIDTLYFDKFATESDKQMAWLFIIMGIIMLGILVNGAYSWSKDLRRYKQLKRELEKTKKDFENIKQMDIDEFLKSKNARISKESCSKILREIRESLGTLYLFHLDSEPLFPLSSALKYLEKGNYELAASKFRIAKIDSESFKIEKYLGSEELTKLFGVYIYDDYKEKMSNASYVLDFASRACDAIYLGDITIMKKLLAEARANIKERDKFYISGTFFFRDLFEFHYFLLKAVVDAYEAEQREVQRLMAAEKEKFKVAEETGAEVPAEVQKVSDEEPERELYRGEVRFTMGALSQERVGMLVITNKRVKLHGKYRLRGTVATVALKAALRAAGVGEVNEEFSLKEIEWIELKKALLGGYYLELKAKGKKYTIYTDAAQHIYNLLRQNR